MAFSRISCASATVLRPGDPLPRWSVDIIRRRAEHLGEVDAPDEQAAINRAAEVFDIPPERQNRISVRRIGKDEK